MGTTPTYGLPYPEATDFVTNGAAAIQALAEETEAELTAAAAAASAAYVARSEAQSARVETAESTTSGTFVDLATVGPAVTVTIGASGRALVIIGASTYNGTANFQNSMAFAISGATIVAATDTSAYVQWISSTSASPDASAAFVQTGLTPGSNTFTAKYAATGGSAFFRRRRITVIPL